MSDEDFNIFLKELKLDNEKLLQVYTSFLQHIELGLKIDTKDQSDIKCFQTYVQDLPRGDENGKFLALDLGGTNFRVLLVTLKGLHEAIVESEIYLINPEIMAGTGKDLFDHIVDCLARFVKKHQLQELDLPLGFTFSFPCTQIGLKHAILQRWTKGFKCSGVVGEDVGQLLKQAIERHGDLRINCVALLNDTTGTLMSCAHRNPKCRVGVIVGTGSNICYVERVSNIDVEPEYRKKPNMLINTECGAFGDGGHIDFIRTEYDLAVDKLTPNSGKQIFEKMISGMYLGEIVRFIIVKALQENFIFSKNKHRLDLKKQFANNMNCFETRFISEIEADSKDFKNTKIILKNEFGINEVSEEDCKKLQLICECISRRSALLVGTVTSALINKICEKDVVVGVDGSVYRFHPKYDGYMREIMQYFVRTDIEYDLMLSEDGSGRGAALVAAVASKDNC